MLKDKQFYNQESANYSTKRYPAVASSYTQFFFKKRLELVLEEIDKATKNKYSLNLLEVGCADGVVLRSVNEKLGNRFARMAGIDIAEEMIEQAKILTPEGKINYFLRGQEGPGEFDVILEIGVINYSDFDEDLIYAKNKLKSLGLYFISVAGSNSLLNVFGKSKGYNNYLSYDDYENKIKNNYRIIKCLPVGFYLPLLWRFPALGRFVQPLLESFFRLLLPNLFHEKIYILAKK